MESSARDSDPVLDPLLGTFVEALAEGRSVDLDTVLPERPDLRDQVAEIYELARSITIREPARLPNVRGYEVLSVLGRGGMGTVYLARQERLERLVALKMVHLSGPGADRFHLETRAIAKLDHPNIVPIYDVGEVDGVPYYTTQYVRGRSLAEAIRDLRSLQCEPKDLQGKDLLDLVRDEEASELPRGYSRSYVDVVCQLGITIAKALDHAHERGVIHRDVKPSNVLLRSDGYAMLFDFGLARIDSERGMTQVGAFLGTLHYAAPEQATGREDLDKTVDIYSLGVTLYEMLTFRVPYHAKSTEELLHRLATREPDSPRRWNPRIPRDLETILHTAMERDPRRRYQEAGEFAMELRRFLAGRPIEARPLGAVGRVLRLARRHRGLAALGAFTALLVLALPTALWLQERTASRAIQKQRDRVAAANRDVKDLAIVKTIEELKSRAEVLWPARPEHVPAMLAWIDDVEVLGARRDRLRSAVAHLGSQAVALSPEERSRWLQVSSETIWWRETKDTLDHYEALVASPREVDPETRARWEDWARRLRADLEALETRMLGERARVFAGDADETGVEKKWRYELLVERVAELERLFVGQEASDTGRHVFPDLPGVRARVQRAEEWHVQSVSSDDARMRWNDARGAIASHPAYGGLDLGPQDDLLPLGADPHSGLWEFAHVPSGSVPEREANGRLEYDDAAAIVFVLIPGGRFAMGAQARNEHEAGFDAQAQANEGPVHEVALEPYFIAKHELTQHQFESLSGYRSSFHSMTNWKPTGRHPAFRVTRMMYDRALTRYELYFPTEAQWEFACRAGRAIDAWRAQIAPWDRIANLADESAASLPEATGMRLEAWNDGQAELAPVGTYEPNAFGLYDMHGNVEEWCRDRVFTQGYATDPHRAGDGLHFAPGSQDYVLRGGSYVDGAEFARPTTRRVEKLNARRPAAGVRPVRAIRRP